MTSAGITGGPVVTLDQVNALFGAGQFQRPWRGQDNAGKPINVIYYGLHGWPSRCTMFVPGINEDPFGESRIDRADARCNPGELK